MGQKTEFLMNFSKKKLEMVKNGWNRIKMDRNGMKWIEMARMVKTAHMAKPAKIAKIAKNGQKQPKMVENGWNWIDMDGNE